jgi:DNA topoisomerase-1
LKDFWRDFIGAVDDIKELRVAEVLSALDEMLGPHIYPPRADGGDVRQCPTCGTGKLHLKAGKFGAFVGCSNYPECRYTRPLAADSEAASADRVLGQDPESGLDVTVKAGRFGPYIQLGEQKDYPDGEKPKRTGIPKGINAADVDLDLALKLLSLPRDVGKHPETGLPIIAGLGRFGPFVKHDKTYASLEAGDEVFDIGLNRAVTLIAEKAAKGPSRRFGADPGKVLGDHPSLGAVAVKSGRYGPYVTAGGVNATIPSELDKDAITLEQAIGLIDERAAKGGRKAKGAKPGEAKPAKKAAVKKAAKPKSDATSKARAPVAKAAKTSAAKPAAASKAAAKKSAGKAR